MSHKPNPFDFVPFVESGPNLYPLKNFVESEETLTGYLTVRIKALTPVHIVGDQDAVESSPIDPKERREGKKDYRITKSKFLRRDGRPMIPSSTIRGCLRSFLEAATNGWVSQCTPSYEEESGIRKYGFKVISDSNTDSVSPKETLSLQEEYATPRQSGEFTDIPSFLFGHVAENEGALKGRVVIEDAEIQESNLACSDEISRYQIPDIKASAFMGGPHPCASSWWYLHPQRIRLNEIKDENGAPKKDRRGDPIVAVDFIGSGFRGRKFYYHQSPYESYAWYKNPINWPEDNIHPIYPIPIECLKQGLETNDFRIYFEEIPESLLKILILALTTGSPGTEPGKPTLRHKLGYGKAYGYGSVEYTITGGRIRGEKSESTECNYIDMMQEKVISSLWDIQKLNEIGIGIFLHMESLEGLAKILLYEEPLSIDFYYPTFNEKGFKSLIRKESVLPILTNNKRNKIILNSA
ncbi:MAG: hypothetical protein K9I59_04275 [Chlorobium sp.]|uniref:RAMP superfamily CRISPR-associated protein n=1 Tax=Chlorobium sp. TaxID=1095 RepID=UPI0025BF4C8D|nr:RAMP superfamily CRISPR-associated protein [Chlorobium sp.]MCF8215998.1 hypothetical protein [Chlorobium sp.]MCF8270507.1 hypothetical protein [Chlorobium sp.]MCF8287273.1 hypothetical protein [Chlorobium sp.]MCF8290475.1 hypothetical protein [Chlorobium sp.]MCF8384709.1 hypothetical protein [Chlorobium sp.]